MHGGYTSGSTNLTASFEMNGTIDGWAPDPVRTKSNVTGFQDFTASEGSRDDLPWLLAPSPVYRLPTVTVTAYDMKW